MKKVRISLFVFFASCSALFLSCSQTSESSGEFGVTLKSAAEKRDRELLWTRETERNALSDKIGPVDGFFVVPDSRNIFLAPPKNFCGDVWPEADGFYRLNPERLPPDSLQNLECFLDALVNDEEDPGAYFNSSGVWSLAIFLGEVKKKYPETAFSWYALGEPFIGDGYWQCPVRLFFRQKKAGIARNYSAPHADIFVYAGKSTGWRPGFIELKN